MNASGDERLGPARPRELGLGARSLIALGVVYGDLGTSPLYALRDGFGGTHALHPNAINVLGILSLVFWSLVLVVSVKYLAYVFRADNRGEGGILALVALLRREDSHSGKNRWLLMTLGLFGAALLYGDGTITPAISVLSAVEGLEIAAPALAPFVIPSTLAVLVGLFAFQRRGTSGVSAVFSPVMIAWFLVIALLGARGVARHPAIFAAIDPRHAARFFAANGTAGFFALGAVVLALTGVEALYADMGHVGKKAIRVAWFALVLPALVLNYFGQGALLLERPGTTENPFYLLAPRWAHFPLVALATIAAIIASQAIISGAFSLTRQAIHLGYAPRMRVVHTAAEEVGQVYLPGINWLLMAITILLVLGFRRSTHLAAAYGIAVATTMAITTLLAYFVSREVWRWPREVAVPLTGALLVVDVAFFGANIAKLRDGGWVPLLMAAVAYALMSSWNEGRRRTREARRRVQVPLDEFLDRLAREPPERVAGTGIFLSRSHEVTPLALSSQFMHYHVLHERVVLLTIATRSVPFVPQDERVEVTELAPGVYRVIAAYGFMQSPRMPAIFRACGTRGLSLDLDAATFFVGFPDLVPGSGGLMRRWRTRLFAVISRNTVRTTSFFHVPHRRVIEIGVEHEV